jgi:hypothetical protein
MRKGSSVPPQGRGEDEFATFRKPMSGSPEESGRSSLFGSFFFRIASILLAGVWSGPYLWRLSTGVYSTYDMAVFGAQRFRTNTGGQGNGISNWLSAYAGPYAIVHSMGIGKNWTEIHETIAVGKGSQTYPWPMTERLREWEDTSWYIVCWRNMYVNYPVILLNGLGPFRVPYGHTRILTSVWSQGSYERVIAMGHPLISNYAHAVMDTFVHLFGFPRQIIDTSYFVTSLAVERVLPPYVSQALSWFGLSERLIVLSKKEYIWANYSYAYKTSYYGQPPDFLRKMRFVMIDKLGLDRKPPSLYGLMNRKNNRMILNMYKVLERIRAVYKDVKWELVSYHRILEETAILFNNIRFLMGVNGAGMTNMLYMQPNSVVCELQTIDTWYFMRYGEMLGLYFVEYRFWGLKHFGQKGANLDLDDAIQIVAAGLKALNSAGS